MPGVYPVEFPNLKAPAEEVENFYGVNPTHPAGYKLYLVPPAPISNGASIVTYLSPR